MVGQRKKEMASGATTTRNRAGDSPSRNPAMPFLLRHHLRRIHAFSSSDLLYHICRVRQLSTIEAERGKERKMEREELIELVIIMTDEQARELRERLESLKN